ncbi:hypothetical protein GTA08_BOTSDO08363 [Neofusicoccum parvum]|uniref:Uncharacterized protein n=1 Tax=Neofusicoccum parvum TaxID=310453 RepID=A0ACB5RZK8_9PEZI|nr:hypothetical protein GTA08_BOTSDO08363 [Neofusicoccum parvum]
METDTVRTCQNCAHAKIRCNRSRPEGSCDRCQRLDKECVFRPARRRFNAPPREPRSDGLASIEAKLDHLISLHASPQPTLTGSRTATPDACDVVDAGAVTFQAAEYYVELYKSTLTPHFPFVVLPQDTSAQQLRREKPLLFLAVLASAAYGDVAVQRDLAMRMRNVIAEYLAGRGSMSFELLQALLVHLAWSQYHPKPKRYSQYLQLAVSIIVDQRLDRHPRTRRWKTHVGASAEEHFDEAQPPHASRSPDVQRAVAGCYYLSSSISTLLQKLNTFQCNTYIEDCCKSLSAEPKFPTDRYLHSIIYLQRITESIDPPSDSENMAAHPSAGTATSNFEHFHSTISSFEVNVPFHMSDSDMVMMLNRIRGVY